MELRRTHADADTRYVLYFVHCRHVVYYAPGDLCYAGAVSPPSQDVLFSDLLKGDAGSAEGLQILGVVDDIATDRARSGAFRMQKTDKLRVAKVKKLHQYIRNKLKSKNKSRLMPDMFHFEHLLCKVKRVIDKGPKAYRTFAAFEANFERMKAMKAKVRAAKKAKKSQSMS